MILKIWEIAITLFFLFGSSNQLIAQHAVGDHQVKGQWFSPTALDSVHFNWEAQWIWLEEETASDVMLARRSFELHQVPERAELRITASSQYQLFVNGKYICRGPARCAPHHQSFDILDVKDLLQEGKNVLAVRVHYQKGKRSYHLNGRAGLLVQLDMILKNKVRTISSNDNWKVSPDPSWDNESPKISRFQLVVSDRVDLRKKIAGWSNVSFDDANWPKASLLMRNVGWPGPQKNAIAQTLTPPWVTLVPRDLPYLNEMEEKAVDLIEAKQINEFPVTLSGSMDERIAKYLPAYRSSSNHLLIPPSGTPERQFLLFDFGKVYNGTAQLDIEGASGTNVEILSAPFIIDRTFSHKVVDSDFHDRIILSGERDQWEATYFKPTRYLGIAIENGNEPIKIHSVGMRYLRYPFEKKGRIHSEDGPWVVKYMEASAKTIDVCTTDGYTDNYRERRQYGQTGYYAALGNYWLFGDQALQRRYLIQVAQEQEANGMMPAYAPLASDDYMIIMDSNCLWIRGLRNYFLFTGDSITVRKLLPAARKLMRLLHSYTHPLGFIYNPPYPYWLDHAQNDRRGANFCLNGHYLGALEDFTQVLNWLDEPGEQTFEERADLLRKSLRDQMWDEGNGLFVDAWVDGKKSNQFSEHANAMALAMHVATPLQAKLIVDKLLENDHNNFIIRSSGMIVVTPAMSYFLHKGLCEYGYVQESIDLFRKRFDKMLQSGTNSTLWEEWWLDGTGRSGKFQGGRTRSDAQTESAFPPALFGEYLLGVNPVKPGMKEINISRPRSDIRQIEAMIPSPEGDLHVKWNFSQKPRGELELEIPGDMRVKLKVANLKVNKNQPIVVNGAKLVEKSGKPFLHLTRGSHRISF